MQAWAAEVSGAAQGAEPFFHAPEFWVALAFVIMVAAFGRKAWATIATGLDDKAETIRNRIEEAEQLHQEAKELLASYQRRQREAADEVGRITDHARAEAERLAARAAKDLEIGLKRREQQALDRIARAEAEAVSQVRQEVAGLALDATRHLLLEKAVGKKADALIDNAIEELPNKLH
ncbi:MAG: F0F1 ATP synthase subunit B [Magnetospirillum sp. WYHS-4]